MLFRRARLGRRNEQTTRSLGMRGVNNGGGSDGGVREGTLALTCLSCVVGVRAAYPRITDGEVCARTSTGLGARS